MEETVTQTAAQGRSAGEWVDELTSHLDQNDNLKPLS